MTKELKKELNELKKNKFINNKAILTSNELLLMMEEQINIYCFIPALNVFLIVPKGEVVRGVRATMKDEYKVKVDYGRIWIG